MFAEARELESDARSEYLKHKCGDDVELLRELQSLLQMDLGSGMLDSPVSSFDLPPGRLVADRFRIVRPVARGGMGIVFEAEDIELRDTVALKVIRTDFASSANVLGRFRQEVLLGKKVTHPNACRIYDLGIDRLADGSEFLFLTMEFLRGETLASHISKGPIPEEEALDLIADMLDALEAAHKAGVIHSDFKSANVILVSSQHSRRAVVTDFGLARSIGEQNPNSAGTGFIGTVEYMAPEQIRGEAISTAVDLYALGVVMYEMATGLRPFTGNTYLSIAIKHLSEKPKPPDLINPNLSARWVTSIRKCLEKDPRNRFHSVEELRHALGNRALYQRRFSPWLSLILTIFALLTTSAIVMNIRRHPMAAQPLNVDVAVAVLPFRPDVQTTESEAFGFTSELNNALREIPGVHLVGPDTANHYKNASADPMGVGRALHVRYMLAGEIRRINHQTRVYVSMLDSKDGAHLFDREIVRPEQEVLLISNEIAREVSRKLSIDLSDTTLPSESFDAGGLTARDLYWTGRFLFHQRTDESVSKALEYFRQAVRIDPNYAEAHCGVSDALFVLAERGLLPADSSLNEARQSAYRAIAINKRLPVAFVSLAQVTSIYDRNLDLAESLFRHAITLDPRMAPAWQWLSYQLVKERRFPDAVHAAENAVNYDPLSTAANMNLLVVYYYAGLYDHALQQSRKLAEMDPNLFVSHLVAGEIFAHKGLYSEALHEMSSIPEEDQGNPMTLRTWVEVYSLQGRKAEAQEALESLLKQSRNGVVPPSFVAIAYASIGDRDQAISWMKRGFKERDAFASMANAFPAFDFLRADRRWQNLMLQFGFKPSKESGSSVPNPKAPTANPSLLEHHRDDLGRGSVGEISCPASRFLQQGFPVQA